MSSLEISEKAAFDFIRYASVWEDADILCDALAPSSKNGRILSIASSGDNVLALLTLDPAEIVAADLSEAQLACVEIRMAAFKLLDHPAILAFLGVTPSTSRMETYKALREHLSPQAQNYWDAHSNSVETGLIHAGKFERYLRLFGTKILPWIESKWKRNALLNPKDLSEQISFYDHHWDTWLWRSFFKVFFSRTIMGFLGRDPSFFDHVEGSVGERILSRTRHAMTALPTYSNPYLVYILTGNYLPNALPRYLRPQFKEEITSRLNRVVLFQGPIQATGKGKFNGYNLSDIFEYMNEQEFKSCYEELLMQAAPKARLAYWNMLVPRKVPKEFENRVHPLEHLAKTLHYHDKAWFYQAFHVEEVKG